LATLTAHAGAAVPPPPATSRPHVPPLYQTAGFEYPDSAHAEEAALGRGYLYARHANPTEDALAQTVARLEGAEAALTFASGMGAIAAALETYLAAGQHLVATQGLYGGTHELITAILPHFGVAHTLVDEPRAVAVETALRPETAAVYVESISNPLLRVADLDAIAALCRARGVPLLVDATFATPLAQRPIERGATLSIHSATKYLAGHGDVTAGVVSGAASEIAKVHRLRKFHGANLDPFGAWLVLRGLRTLALRFERQTVSAERIARALAGWPAIARVHHPALADHPDHDVAAHALARPGAMVAFELGGGLAAARRVYDRVRLVARAASLGDVTSLLTHPARFSHVHLSDEERRRAGITDGLLRLSVGIEDPDDLLADLEQAVR
jgi:methionine-gamma-lyase